MIIGTFLGQWSVAVMFFFVLSLKAQRIGGDSCACQPAVYEITLALGLTCEDNTIFSTDPGIKDVDCTIGPRLPGTGTVSDFVPVTVTEIQVLELGQNLAVVGQTVFNDGPYVDGEKVTYTSVVNANPDSRESLPPLGIQLSISGKNAMGETLINAWQFCTTMAAETSP